jgi:hypothetical protein
MTTFRWSLIQVKLEGSRLFSEIVTWFFENAVPDNEDTGLEGMAKNPYHHIKRRKLQYFRNSKLRRKTSKLDVHGVGLQSVANIDAAKYPIRMTQ